MAASKRYIFLNSGTLLAPHAGTLYGLKFDNLIFRRQEVIQMNKINVTHNLIKTRIGIGVLVLALIVTASVAFSHGGKHTGKEFNHLQALQKATGLYNRLVEKGKLDPSWETELTGAAVFTRKNTNNDEVVVSFHRAKGDPQAVYIFFSPDGKYTGSNFTGD
jgi:hypothetical protein